jgi:hypothetical protein
MICVQTISLLTISTIGPLISLEYRLVQICKTFSTNSLQVCGEMTNNCG